MENIVAYIGAITGIIGCITGIASLIWHIHKNKPKIKIVYVKFTWDKSALSIRNSHSILKCHIKLRNVGDRTTTIEGVTIRNNVIYMPVYPFDYIPISPGETKKIDCEIQIQSYFNRGLEPNDLMSLGLTVSHTLGFEFLNGDAKFSEEELHINRY